MATITAAAGGGNWNVGSTWVGGSVPLITDNVILNGTSGQVTISSSAQCVDINFTGYTNTITFNANLTITGNLTRIASIFSYAGTGGIIIAGTTTQIITTTSVAWTIPVTFGGASPSISINGAFNISAALTLSSTTSPVISRANVFDLTENVNASGNITISGNGTYTGSAAIKITGTATQTLTASGSHQIRNNLTIDKSSGVLTLSGTLNYNTGTLTYVASGGTINATAMGLIIRTNTTLNTGAISWGSFTVSYTQVLSPLTVAITLNSDLNVSGALTLIANANPPTLTFTGTGNINATGDINITQSYFGGGIGYTVNFVNTVSALNLITSGANTLQTITLNGGTLNLSGGITLGNTFAGIVGTTNINLVGTGNINCGSGASAMSIRNNLTINTSGTITLVNNLNYSSSTFKYISGTLNFSSFSLVVSGTTTLDTSGVVLSSVIFSNSTTTLLSNLNVSNLTTQGTSVSFAGAFTINVEGNLAINITTSGASTPIVINGTGSQTWSHGSAVYLSNNLTINKASGTLTLGANVYYRIGTLTHTLGTVDTTTNSSILNIGGSTTLNTSGINWYRLICGTTATITLTSNLNITNYAQYFNGTITHPGGGIYNLTGDLYIGNNTSSINVTFTNTDINIVNLFVNLRLGYTYVVNNGSANINISGNYTLNNMDNSSGTITCTPIRFVGNGTWSCVTTVAGFYASHNGNITIDTAGTITFGTIVFLGGGTISKLSGNVNLTGNTFFYVRNGTINTPDITWNNVFFVSSGASTMGLANNLYVANTFICGGQGTISGAFNIYCGNCNINNSSSGATNTTITYSGIIYCSNNLTFSGNTGVSSITGTVYVGGSVFFNAPASTQGAGNIYMVGNGVISSLNIIYPINTNLYFDTGGKITISTPINFANGAARIINLIRGNIDASKCDLYLNQSFNHTLTNMNKIAWRSVRLSNAASLTMNEFFCGTPNIKTIVASTVASNYTVTFTDNFEKIAKFVNITNCTLTRPQQLLVLTDSKKSSTNRGIRYINSLPNGISKGDPSIQNILTPGQSNNLLIGDPAFVKTI